MDGARPRPVRSFGQLAERALRQAEWPVTAPLRPRSLASIFSKLDRGIDLDWLRDRREVQRALVAALGCEPSEVDGALGAPRAPTPTSSARVRLHAVRWAQALDLGSEPLPPGIPAEVLRADWDKLCWAAPGGAGRALAGQWLAARGLARRVRAPTLTEAAAVVAGSAGSRSYLEIDRAGPRDAEALARLAAGRGAWCVALPHATSPSLPANVALVRAPRPETYVGALAEWLDARISRDGHYRSDEAAAWIRERALPRRWATDFGSTLGWLGVCDELGVAALERASARRIVEAWLALRAREALDASDATSWLARDGWELLLALVRGSLLAGGAELDAALSRSAWLELVPDELVRAPDLDWWLASVSETERAARARELERARRRLPPGAFRAVRGLERAGVLRAVADPAAAHGEDTQPRRADAASELLCLGPRWLLCLLRESALDSIARGSALEWGEALLGSRSGDIARALGARVIVEEASPLGDEAELDAMTDPAAAAAVEGAARVAGLALLGGAALSETDAAELFTEAVACALTLDGRLTPRVAYAHDAGAALSLGGWWLALLALSERANVRPPRHAAAAAPWRADSPSPLAPEILDAIHDALATAHAERTPWSEGALALIDRLRAVAGATRVEERLHPLHAPGSLLDEVALGVVSWSTIDALRSDPAEVDALECLAKRRGIPWTDVVRAVWRSWVAAGLPETDLLAPDSPAASRLWPGVPVEVVPAIVGAPPERWRPPHTEGFDAARWRALLAALHPEHGVRARQIVARAPEQELEGALRAWLARGHLGLVAEAWTRLPAPIAAWVGGALASGACDGAVELLTAAPPEATPHVVRAIAGARASEALPEPVTRWLHDRVRLRAPGWREAFSLLPAAR